jgi:hypothetical protein
MVANIDIRFTSMGTRTKSSMPTITPHFFSIILSSFVRRPTQEWRVFEHKGDKQMVAMEYTSCISSNINNWHKTESK